MTRRPSGGAPTASHATRNRRVPPVESLRMTPRVCMVTPFASSRPHPVNEHVSAAARALRARGHEVVVLAPSNRAKDLAAGRRALRRLEREGRPLEATVAVGPAVPVSRRSRLGVPVGVRANLTLALSTETFDVLHAHDPGVPSLSYLALRHGRGLTVATFHSVERLAYPPGKAQRERLLARTDALTATSPAVAEAAARRFPGDYRVLPLGVDAREEARPRDRFVIEWRADESDRLRAALRALAELTGFELVVLRTRPLAGRPYIPARCAAGCVRTAFDAAARARELAGAAGFVPATAGDERIAVEAAAAGVPPADPPGSAAQPALVGAALARLAEDPEHRRARSEAVARERARTDGGAARRGARAAYGKVVQRRRATYHAADLLADRPWILCDLHLHTDHSHDCSMAVEDVLDYAEAQGLGAIAITDHNVFAGAREAVELTRSRAVTVIPGEEVKTDQGEVIGALPRGGKSRGMTMGETIMIREQGGLVYLPPVRPPAHDSGRAHPPPASGRDRRLRGLQRAAPAGDLQRRGAPLRAESTTSPWARAPTRTCCRGSAPASSGCAPSTGRRSSSSACGRPRSCGGRSRSSTSRASSGGPARERRAKAGSARSAAN